MAYDPEAREAGNTAMIIGVVALVIVVGGILAWLAVRPREQPVVVERVPDERVVINNEVPVAPVPVNPPAVVVAPPPPAVSRSTVVTRNTTRDRVITAPAPSVSTGGVSTGTSGGSPPAAGGSSSTTNVINVNPPAAAPKSGGGGATSGGAAKGGSDSPIPVPESSNPVATSPEQPRGY